MLLALGPLLRIEVVVAVVVCVVCLLRLLLLLLLLASLHLLDLDRVEDLVDFGQVAVGLVEELLQLILRQHCRKRRALCRRQTIIRGRQCITYLQSRAWHVPIGSTISQTLSGTRSTGTPFANGAMLQTSLVFSVRPSETLEHGSCRHHLRLLRLLSTFEHLCIIDWYLRISHLDF